MHVAVPPEHTVLPAWHSAPVALGVHGAMFVHGLQTPPRQYWPIPHGLPSLALPMLVQTGAPVEHTTLDCWQEPASLQSAPIGHATQEPALQTAPESHIIPSITVPDCVQARTPPSQVSLPVWHAAGVHMLPGVQVLLPPSASPPASGCGPTEVSGPASPTCGASTVESVPESDEPLPSPTVKSPKSVEHAASTANAPSAAIGVATRLAREILKVASVPAAS
jgi:hypothetical protein